MISTFKSGLVSDDSSEYTEDSLQPVMLFLLKTAA